MIWGCVACSDPLPGPGDAAIDADGSDDGDAAVSDAASDADAADSDAAIEADADGATGFDADAASDGEPRPDAAGDCEWRRGLVFTRAVHTCSEDFAVDVTVEGWANDSTWGGLSGAGEVVEWYPGVDFAACVELDLGSGIFVRNLQYTVRAGRDLCGTPLFPPASSADVVFVPVGPGGVVGTPEPRTAATDVVSTDLIPFGRFLSTISVCAPGVGDIALYNLEVEVCE